MLKADAVANLGQTQLLRPAWIKAALAANDRLKLYLTVLQAAQAHAEKPGAALVNLSHEFAAAQVNAPWLLELPGSAFISGDALQAEGLLKLYGLLEDDLLVMARPLIESAQDDGFSARVGRWREKLQGQSLNAIAPDFLRALTSGRRDEDDSFHILVMDMHKALNALAASLASETLDGAHVWQLQESDRPRVSAFMNGLNRTFRLKLTHPGLDTAATSDGDRLLLQNDIGTNDAHVLVIQAEGRKISLTYSDLHARRFSFFEALLSELGAVWSKPDIRTTAGLNEGEAYRVGVALFECADEDGVLRALEGIGSRIVFLIDWNRARKRLNLFVGKEIAPKILAAAARAEKGHMGWLAAGAEHLVFEAMQTLGPDYFRIGDRLDAVMGEAEAAGFLINVLALCSGAMLEGRSASQISDQTRTLLLQRMRRRLDAFDHLAEHAAYCHALASGLRDGLAHGCEKDKAAAVELGERAKNWERMADALVNQSRERSARRPRAQTFTRLIEGADDVADALEEATFNLSLIAETECVWSLGVRQGMQSLSDAVLDGVQDYVRALAVAQDAGAESGARDQEEFLSAAWRVFDAEQRCDLLLRDVKRTAVQEIKDSGALMLSLDFAAALEGASDALLLAGYRLRDLVQNRMEAQA